MAAPIIRVENLGKRYRIRHQAGGGRGYRRLSEELWNAARAPFIRAGRRGTTQQTVQPARASSEDFWALRDVSFEVSQGEVLGIVGRNGAGKSTLLKVLSRITEPTEGRVRIRGRLASLLEVGTGFHPELTGRENIFLNGAIVGMTRAEIKRKFDEIVAFAEVEKFLDTPVKRYSSGMYVRLAFAVAAHLDPEILVIDEVLAVGDAQFQKKCLGRMSEVAAGGRTVLFVSHNMNAVESLCTRAIHLQKGQAVDEGNDVRGIITRYLSGDADGEAAASAWTNTDDSLNHPVMQPLYFAVETADGRPLTGPVRNDEPLFVVIRAEVRQLDPSMTVGYAIYSEDGTLLYWSYQTDTAESEWPRLRLGRCVLKGRIPSRLLNEGTYRIELIGGLHCREWFFKPGESAPHVSLTVSGGLSDSPIWKARRPGVLAPVIDWMSDSVNENHDEVHST